MPWNSCSTGRGVKASTGRCSSIRQKGLLPVPAGEAEQGRDIDIEEHILWPMLAMGLMPDTTRSTFCDNSPMTARAKQSDGAPSLVRALLLLKIGNYQAFLACIFESDSLVIVIVIANRDRFSDYDHDARSRPRQTITQA
jgi:hypothetical protein